MQKFLSETSFTICLKIFNFRSTAYEVPSLICLGSGAPPAPSFRPFEIDFRSESQFQARPIRYPFSKNPFVFFSKKKSSFLKICKKAFQKFNNRPTYTGVENLRGQLGTIPDFCRADKISKKYFENLDMFYCFLP